ncbi:3D domain-containing protein [Ammoniphilus resinae]|uniref:3D (Asp-Asp-Asp) domain-containing protein n=1 Tax=Ammoniphilus resinae TaxID=861532 RepID=A0ABS4GM77_9BACL|nr:3D domain-containing protein [Ammoniphilus resinae]MBP1931212.1 3D (Asp-Asp-Asp) domain-containing protein [Ammoniphilus resinae]
MNKWKKRVISIGVTISLFAMATPTFAASYTVKEKDTLWEISKTHQISLAKLQQENPTVDALNLQPGQTINLPEKNEKQQNKTAKITMASKKSLPEYSKVITAISTAYTSAPSENGKWGAVDYFGNPLKLGTIAVDPKVIPLGTKVFIEGYSSDVLPSGGMYAVASDVGGKVKGNRIDIFLPTTSKKAWTFGKQNVKVYLLGE